MRLVVFALATLTVLSSQAFACDEPETVSIPNGKKASDAEMREAGVVVHEYLLAMQVFQECLSGNVAGERARKGRRDTERLQDERKFVAEYNKAAGKMKKVIRTFSVAVEDYKGQQGG